MPLLQHPPPPKSRNTSGWAALVQRRSSASSCLQAGRTGHRVALTGPRDSGGAKYIVKLTAGEGAQSSEESPQMQPKWNIRCKQSFILGGPVLKLKTDKHVWEFERLTQKSPGPWMDHYVEAVDPTSELALIFSVLPWLCPPSSSPPHAIAASSSVNHETT